MTSWIRSSLRRKGPQTFGYQEREPGSESSGRIIAETFERHWHQLRGIAAHNTAVPSLDDVVAVVNLLDQMIALLQMELATEAEDVLSSLEDEGDSNHGDPLSLTDSNSPCLDILLSENIPAHILAASRMPLLPEQQDKLRGQQLKLYEALLGGSSLRAKHLLSHQPFLKPLLDLLSEFVRNSEVENDTKGSRNGNSRIVVEFASLETEMHLVMVLNLLCSRLMEKDNAHLFQVFFNVEKFHNGTEENSSPTFLIFSILVDFLHRDGLVGQQARDAILLVMSLSKKHEEVGKHIAKSTNFCPVLATGLSGLYSLLPRHLELIGSFRDSSWYQITPNYLPELPEVVAFLSSLQFCDAVVQVAHPSVRQHLLGLIYMGFLVPVLGPALTQTVESELICSTAYVNLFLQQISEPALLAVFLRFIFTDTCDGKNIIDTLTERISSQSQLCIVTLSLFETLVSLNCEDVMLWLVFRHLIPMQHLLPSQKNTIRQPDLLGRAAEKLLSLTPICCLESRSSIYQDIRDKGNQMNLPTFLVGLARTSVEEGIALDQPSSLTEVTQFGYNSYLMDARNSVRIRHEATQCWLYEYDGINPPPALTKSSSFQATDPHELRQRLSRHASLSCDTSSITLNLPNISLSSSIPKNDDVTKKSGDVTMNENQPVTTSTPMGTGPPSMTEDEVDKDFWNLMREGSSDSAIVAEAKLLQSAMKRLQQQSGDSLSLSSGGLSLNSSQDELSPIGVQEALDYSSSCNSLGPFLDLLLEKVELMASNDLTTNLLVTSILSQLASYPQPLLRSVLIHPDVVLQPSVRGLFSAIASVRQKLDNIMPTLTGAEEAVQLARKFLIDRVTVHQLPKRRDSNVSIMSSISQFGQEARATKNSFSAAFSSMFRRKSDKMSYTDTSPSVTMSPQNDAISQQQRRSMQFSRRLGREVRQHALAAVVLEEWLQELAAIAQEQSVLQKEQAAYQLSLAASVDKSRPEAFVESKHNSNILTSKEEASEKETRS